MNLKNPEEGLSRAYPESKLPDTYAKARKYIHHLGLGYEKIDVCKNNYVLFRGEDLEKAEVCPRCNTSRWEEGSKQTPHKVLRHVSLTKRLQRIFAYPKTAEYAEWHKTKRKEVDGVLSHPADGKAWKHFDKEHKADPRNLRLSVATDGFNPFGNFSSTYSMWPVLVTPLNLPPWECTDSSNCFMSLLIPGPRSPGKDFDLFLEPLIDELLQLWDGVKTRHVLLPRGDTFNLRAAVLWCVHDFPALSTMSGQTTKGYFACIYCDKQPLSRSLRHKIGYFGHR